MTKRQARLVQLTACAALLCGALPMAGAMHIMEGFLPPAMCVVGRDRAALFACGLLLNQKDSRA